MTSAEYDAGHVVESVTVWYDNGPVDGTGDAWNDLPKDGAQVVRIYYVDGTSRIMVGNDYYFRAPGPNDYIYGANNNPDNEERYEGAVVLQGRWIDDATFATIAQASME